MSQNKIRVLHFSPHDENDGIAKYEEQYVSAMKDGDVENEFFAVSPLELRHFTTEAKESTYKDLAKKLKDFDILHIQHEFGLFEDDDFQRVFEVAKNADKKTVITVHLSPEFAIKPVKLGGVGPRSLVNFIRQRRHHDKMVERHVTPFTEADAIIVHNDVAANALQKAGVPVDRIVKIPHPVYKFETPPKTNEISKELNKKPGDVIFCTVGMIHRYKGVADAVRALKFLPDNYKLAIIGGVHHLSEDAHMYNDICNLIDTIGVKDRVYITGFVEDDTLMNSYIRECDVSVFPYAKKGYYAHASSGAINLALANEMPVIAYPTSGFSELAQESDGAIITCGAFAYYELVRELKRIDVKKQHQLSVEYGKKNNWHVATKNLVNVYKSLV